MSVFTDKTGGVGHRNPQAHPANHRQVGQVVAEVGDVFMAQAELGQQSVQHHQLVFATLINMGNAQVHRPTFDRRGLAAADNGCLHTRGHEHLDALAVECVEGVELAAVFKKVQVSVGQHTVDVEDGQFDLFAALQQVSTHYITPARNKSCMFRAPTGRSSPSTTTSALILWSSMIFRASAASISARPVLPWAVMT